MTRAQLDKKPAEVSAMFDKVAERYDLLNDALSLGMDRRWRKVVARAVGAGPGQLVLDLAAGTGTSSRAFIRSGARCVACDFSFGMLSVGARRRAARLGFVAGDALASAIQVRHLRRRDDLLRAAQRRRHRTRRWPNCCASRGRAAG